jgi:hypothetical protein
MPEIRPKEPAMANIPSPEQNQTSNGNGEFSQMTIIGTAAGMALIGLIIVLVGFHFSSVSEKESKGLIIFISMIISLYIFSISARIYFYNRPISDIIPPKDRALLEPLIRSGDTDAINIYIRLSSLSGFTGNLTKVGISGLPLVTIGVTIFFTLIAGFLLFVPTREGQELSSFVDNLLDLAKLSLGAFIGSFVQKNISAAAETGASETLTGPEPNGKPGEERKEEPKKEELKNISAAAETGASETLTGPEPNGKPGEERNTNLHKG